MSPRTLYVIDDEESIRQALSFCLGQEYRVKAFSTAEEALEALESDPPDLVLLDVALPGMNGIEVLRRMVTLNPGIRVIMISGCDDADTIEAARKLKAYGYILKPLHLATLRQVVEKALDDHRQPTRRKGDDDISVG